jgi:hypothetical protein
MPTRKHNTRASAANQGRNTQRTQSKQTTTVLNITEQPERESDAKSNSTNANSTAETKSTEAPTPSRFDAYIGPGVNLPEQHKNLSELRKSVQGELPPRNTYQPMQLDPNVLNRKPPGQTRQPHTSKPKAAKLKWSIPVGVTFEVPNEALEHSEPDLTYLQYEYWYTDGKCKQAFPDGANERTQKSNKYKAYQKRLTFLKNVLYHVLEQRVRVTDWTQQVWSKVPAEPLYLPPSSTDGASTNFGAGQQATRTGSAGTVVHSVGETPNNSINSPTRNGGTIQTGHKGRSMVYTQPLLIPGLVESVSSNVENNYDDDVIAMLNTTQGHGNGDGKPSSPNPSSQSGPQSPTQADIEALLEWSQE